MNLLLVRHAYLPDVTAGVLTADDLRLMTIEEPWIANPHGPGGTRRDDGRESCVPDGSYILTPHSGTQFQNVYRLSNPDNGVFDYPEQVPDKTFWGRSSILIHSGNSVADILGCILVGREFDGYNRIKGGTSRVALNDLRAKLGAAMHVLTIRPSAGTKEKIHV